MKVIEINPPERALYEGPSDPVIFLEHEERNSDGWHSSAVETIINLARPLDGNKIYVANQGRSFFDASTSELESWKSRYSSKALTNGSVIVWLASDDFKRETRRMSPDVEYYLDLLNQDPELPVIFGASRRSSGPNLNEFNSKLRDYNGSVLYSSLRDACSQAINIAVS